MLIDFKVSNFRSFGEEQYFSTVANGKIAQHEDILLKSGKHTLLPSIAIYGANASGKSNLLHVQDVLHFFITKNGMAKIPHISFVLDDSYKNKPTSIETTYLVNKCIFTYSITINNELNEIEKESLSLKKEGKNKKKIFSRDNEKYVFADEIKKYKDVWIGVTNRYQTMLGTIIANSNYSKVSIFADIKMLYSSIEFISLDFSQMMDIYGINYERLMFIYSDKTIKYKVDRLINAIDTSVSQINIIEDKQKKKFYSQLAQQGPLPNLNENKKYYKELYTHKTNQGENIHFQPSSVSKGTKSAFYLFIWIVYCLENGFECVIDEIETSLHPLVIKLIIEMFHNKNINKKNSQLIFTTHNTSLLDEDLFRKDQIYFVEKNEKQMSEIYSLNDFQSRKGENIEKRYLNNMYGATPNIKDIEGIFND